ncbi:ABCA3 [Cordylochernes scorpioides]|uniref:ABCA3 n=1 Tax=Cordylochernes scorpioides TaxID=51811 RepID=A0ABY6L191_9ARAC|nr:ABCA3 [Cordylochernes scorpioides]
MTHVWESPSARRNGGPRRGLERRGQQVGTPGEKRARAPFMRGPRQRQAQLKHRRLQKKFKRDHFSDRDQEIKIQRSSRASFQIGFTTKTILRDMSLECYSGQITALLGHNGAGKTTAINIITGVHRPTSGICQINGYDVVENTAEARRTLGYCPQQDILFPYLTVEQHLYFFAKLKEVPQDQMENEITAVLRKVRMIDKRNHLKDQLSGGMRRKLSLGIALIGGSKVLILDEPTAGLDIEARRSFWDLVMEIRQGRTVLLTTHYMEEADALSDRLAVLAAGRIYCCGSPLFLKRAFGKSFPLISPIFLKRAFEGVTINKQAYGEILVRLRDAIRRKRNQLFKSKQWKLLHDNAPAHRAIIVQDYLAKHSVSVLPHPPYSPDIAPCDFFFFPKLKMMLKGRHFSSSSEVIENATVELNKIRKIDFELEFCYVFTFS